MDFSKLIKGFIRILAPILVAWLVHEGYVSNDPTTNGTVIITTILGVLGWSVADKVKQEAEIEVALDLPAHTTKKTFKERAKEEIGGFFRRII